MNEPCERVFFTDRDLAQQFSERLRKTGIKVERHDDHFGAQTSDAEWLGEVGSRRWVAVSRDTRILYSALALNVLMTSGARLFVLVGKLTTDEAAELFLRSLEQIEALVQKERRPFIAKIRRDGVYMWLQHKTWKKSPGT